MITTVSLNGRWEVYQVDSGAASPPAALPDAPIAATVPGCIHTDLLAAGLIDDPYFRTNELDVLWVGETGWRYTRTFHVAADLLEHDRVLLRANGLDTLATVTVNGVELGKTDNMFRTWEFDVKNVLHAGENSINVAFDPPVPYVRARGQERMLPAWGVGDHKLDGGGWIRKEPCNFGWDWGPMLATSGIWRDLEIIAFDGAHLTDVHIRQQHGDGVVTLNVAAQVESVAPGNRAVDVAVWLEDVRVASGRAAVSDDHAAVTLTITEPQLWWPNNMGAQPLYDVSVTLVDVDAADAELDTAQKRIGLRTLSLVREDDQWGESFYFAANGVPFFAKGANWIPADTFATRLTRADYARLLDDTVAANMNMLRVWGGGLYEQDMFYELCDERGICVWQDFIFACATYPTFDHAWMASVRAEAEDNVRRIRHHACLALWCGNNELEQGLVGDEWTAHTMSWEDYSRLYDEMLPAVVAALDPDTDYWPCSPHSPRGDRRDFNNPNWGDAHLWSVWHGKQPFEWYRTCDHRFNSEFGFQSFPEPRTVRTYTQAGDRNITSFVMEHHQRSGIGNSTIIHYMLDWFRLPTDFDMTLWLSQILQGMAIKYAVEHWRRAMPRGMGTLYWQLNDCWQVASWSSIDYFGNWKALHYMARDFFAPLLISGLEDLERGTVEIHVTSDLAATVDATVRWVLTDVAGAEIAQRASVVAVKPRADHLVETLALRNWLDEFGTRNMLLWLELEVDGTVVSTNLVNFARPKHLELQEPTIIAAVTPAAEGFDVVLETDRPSLWTWLELDNTPARYSSNFVHLRPGVPVTVNVRPRTALTQDEFAVQLSVRSLVDTHKE